MFQVPLSIDISRAQEPKYISVLPLVLSSSEADLYSNNKGQGVLIRSCQTGREEDRGNTLWSQVTEGP